MSENPKAKLPTTTCGYSMLKFALLNDDFLEFFKLEARPVKGQSLQEKIDKKRKKLKRKGIKS